MGVQIGTSGDGHLANQQKNNLEELTVHIWLFPVQIGTSGDGHLKQIKRKIIWKNWLGKYGDGYLANQQRNNLEELAMARWLFSYCSILFYIVQHCRHIANIFQKNFQIGSNFQQLGATILQIFKRVVGNTFP